MRRCSCSRSATNSESNLQVRLRPAAAFREIRVAAILWWDMTYSPFSSAELLV